MALLAIFYRSLFSLTIRITSYSMVYMQGYPPLALLAGFTPQQLLSSSFHTLWVALPR